MRNRLFNPFLRAEEQEHGSAGGAAAPTAPTGTTAPEEQATPPAEQKPGVIEMAVASLKSKAALNGEISALKQQIATANDSLAAMTHERDELAAKVGTYEAEREQLSAALTTATEEKQTVDEAAAAKLRAHGVDPQQLPAAGQDAEETKEALEEKLAKTEDPKERFRLTEKLMALEG